MNGIKRNLILVAGMLSASLCVGQIPLEGSGTYRQDFNTLPDSKNPEPWTDNGSLPGWYAQQSVLAEISDRHGTIVFSDGSLNKGRIYTFGSREAENRALGGLASGSVGQLAIGVQFINSSRNPVLLETVSFQAKQWRDGGGNPQTLTFWYKISPENIDDLVPFDEGWTPVPSLDFDSPSNEGQAVALNEENTFSETQTEKLNLLLNPGEHIMFRWRFPADKGEKNHAFGIDDFTLSYKDHVK